MLIVKLESGQEIQIPLKEIEFSFARSSGPGGQNVNKVNSKAILRWNVSDSPSLPLGAKMRFVGTFASRLTADGSLVVSSDRHRDQGKNVEECLSKLREMIRQVATPPKPRKKTKPSRGSKIRNEKNKRATKHLKQSRAKVRY